MTTSGELVLEFGPFRLLPRPRLLLKAGQPVQLGSRAREILIFLVEHAGQIVRKAELIKRVWPDIFVEEGTLRVHIAMLRKALEDGKRGMRYIESVTGHGYRFVAPLTRLGDSNSSPRALAAHLTAGPVLTRLIGRTQLLQALSAALPEQRLVTLVGPAGVGKTALAVAIASQLRGGYRHDACIVDLGSVSRPELICAALASALGFSPASASLAEIVRQLANRHTLLVLDCCDHIIEAAAVLAETLVRGAPNVHILSTSREPLRIMHESVVRLAPLEIPPPSTRTAAEALGFSAVQLFVERAAAGVNSFEMRDADVPALVDICSRLDGLPLALELAAARVDMFGICGLAERMDDCLELLTRGYRTAIPRHRTLRAALDWSYEILPPAEQVALRRLSVFVGCFDAASAATVLGNEVGEIATVSNLLAELGAKSLLNVRINDDQVTYQLPATTRTYAFEKLQNSGEGAEISRRYAQVMHGSTDTIEPQQVLSVFPERRSRFLPVLRSRARYNSPGRQANA